MTRSEQLIQLVGRDLEQDCTDYQGLQRLMRALYEQLLARNSAQIESINQQIAVLIDLIRSRAQRRTKILAAFSLSHNKPGAMEQLLTLSPPPHRGRFLQYWDDLENLVRETKSLNERNGKLLAMHNDILGQIMGGPQSTQVYSPRYY
jgi:flagellar biosynthesis protein FlgN